MYNIFDALDFPQRRFQDSEDEDEDPFPITLPHPPPRCLFCTYHMENQP